MTTLIILDTFVSVKYSATFGLSISLLPFIYILYCVSDSFVVGTGVDAQTKGIWFRYVTHPTQANCCLLLLDTEGLNDPQKVN